MRTTVTIDDELLRRAKIDAVRSGRTLGQLVEDGLRIALARSEAPRDRRRPELPTYGGSGTLPGVDVADNAALRDIMDADTPADALR